MAMKVLYHIGYDLTTETKMKKGMLYTEKSPIEIVSDGERIVLNHLQKAEKSSIPVGGSVIKARTDSFTVFILVPRVYIERGNGFVIVNRSKTMKLLNLLQS